MSGEEGKEKEERGGEKELLLLLEWFFLLSVCTTSMACLTLKIYCTMIWDNMESEEKAQVKWR